MVTGSMGFDTVNDWFAAGASVIGVGGLITGPAARGDFAAVTENAKKLCQIVQGE